MWWFLHNPHTPYSFLCGPINYNSGKWFFAQYIFMHWWSTYWLCCIWYSLFVKKKLPFGDFPSSKVECLRDALDRCFWNSSAKLTSTFCVAVLTDTYLSNRSLTDSCTLAIRCKMNLFSVELSSYTTSLLCTSALIPRSIIILNYFDHIDHRYNTVARV